VLSRGYTNNKYLHPDYADFKNALIEKYPYFDVGAKDGARYFFGNPNAEVTFIGGE